MSQVVPTQPSWAVACALSHRPVADAVAAAAEAAADTRERRHRKNRLRGGVARACPIESLRPSAEQADGFLCVMAEHGPRKLSGVATSFFDSSSYAGLGVSLVLQA